MLLCKSWRRVAAKGARHGFKFAEEQQEKMGNLSIRTALCRGYLNMQTDHRHGNGLITILSAWKNPEY